jgi:uncharacterized damage-inducible protein DinB
MVWLPYSQLMEVKRWADRGLCEAVALNRDKLNDREKGLMLQVLDHIHVVDRIFQHHLEGKPHQYRAARSEAPPTFDVLAADMQEAGDWYAAYVKRLSPDEFAEVVDFVFTTGKAARMTRAQILLHVCLHGAYHRGNAGAILQLKELVPGPDSITDYLELAA